MNPQPDDATRLSLAIERLVRAFRPLTEEDPLSQAAAAVLSRLDMSGPSGITGLARAERVTQPAMTQLVNRLHGEGLVTREASPSDRRSVVVALTTEGWNALDERRARRARRVAASLESIDADARHRILSALPALEQFIDATYAQAGTRE